MMTAVKQFFLIGGILAGLLILTAAGMAVVFLFLDEASGDGEDLNELTSLSSFSFPLRWGEENQGNEFTGQTAGWLFGISCVPVVFNLTTRFIIRRIPLSSRLKAASEWLSRANRKYLMPFHTYLSILAFALAVIHLLLSNCPNPFPEWGLIGAGILVVTGLIIKLRLAVKISPKLVKWIYQFHTSLVVSGILVSILLAGHVLMD
jgi:hypothetical protein